VTSRPHLWDTIVVGAGAAGLATAIFARTRDPERTVLLLDGARRPGAKILVSGGARCNVTNTVVTERDYWGGPSPFVRRVLRAFPVRDTIAFFEQIGITLHEEQDGKLFPDSNRARDVLDALLAEAARRGVDLRGDHRVRQVTKTEAGFEVHTTAGQLAARRIVLATGGQSLPKSGSDGAGYQMAASLGHTVIPTTPALAPLLLDSQGGLHARISGVSIDAGLTLWVDGAIGTRLRGALLWTHFGISGPVALNVSRHWLRATLEGHRAALTASFTPDQDFQQTEKFWLDASRNRPRSTVGATLTTILPASMAAALAAHLDIDPATPLASLERESRRRLTRALTEFPLAATDSRGYTYAEATAGGVDLREVDPATMASRRCEGLYLVGEILDVDGRLGGFNFQWAWSSGWVAGGALGADARQGAKDKGQGATSTGAHST
jgi:predicted Rossmann fold flavoprotein